MSYKITAKTNAKKFKSAPRNPVVRLERYSR